MRNPTAWSRAASFLVAGLWLFGPGCAGSQEPLTPSSDVQTTDSGTADAKTADSVADVELADVADVVAEPTDVLSAELGASDVLALPDVPAPEDAPPVADVVDVVDAADVPDVPVVPSICPEGADVTPEAPPGSFGRSGDRLLDPQGRTLVLHGVNVSNSAKGSADHMPWQSAQDFQDLADRGFDSVRLVMQWAAAMPEPGVVDEGYLDALEQRVDWAHAAGLLVILDMHQDVFGFGFGGNGAPLWACDQELYDAHEPATPWYMNYFSKPVMACFDKFYSDPEVFGHFVEAWVATAKRFGSHPAVLGFDLLNEPHWGTHDIMTFVADVWQPRMEELAMAIRAVAPGRVVFFEGTTLASLGATDTFLPACNALTAFGPHYYHPLVHDGGAYDPAMLPDIQSKLDGIDAMGQMLGGTPVWVGEFGGITSSPTLPDYLADVLREFAARRWSWAFWCDDVGDGGFALRDATGAFKEAIVGLLGHPYARRVPGELVAQTVEPVAGKYEGHFTWSVAAPLEVWVGAGKTLSVQGDGGEVPCAQAAAASSGVFVCDAPGELGGPFTISIE